MYILHRLLRSDFGIKGLKYLKYFPILRYISVSYDLFIKLHFRIHVPDVLNLVLLKSRFVKFINYGFKEYIYCSPKKPNSLSMTTSGLIVSRTIKLWANR